MSRLNRFSTSCRRATLSRCHRDSPRFRRGRARSAADAPVPPRTRPFRRGRARERPGAPGCALVRREGSFAASAGIIAAPVIDRVTAADGTRLGPHPAGRVREGRCARSMRPRVVVRRRRPGADRIGALHAGGRRLPPRRALGAGGQRPAGAVLQAGAAVLQAGAAVLQAGAAVLQAGAAVLRAGGPRRRRRRQHPRPDSAESSRPATPAASDLPWPRLQPGPARAGCCGLIAAVGRSLLRADRGSKPVFAAPLCPF